MNTFNYNKLLHFRYRITYTQLIVRFIKFSVTINITRIYILFSELMSTISDSLPKGITNFLLLITKQRVGYSVPCIFTSKLIKKFIKLHCLY